MHQQNDLFRSQSIQNCSGDGQPPTQASVEAYILLCSAFGAWIWPAHFDFL